MHHAQLLPHGRGSDFSYHRPARHYSPILSGMTTAAEVNTRNRLPHHGVRTGIFSLLSALMFAIAFPPVGLWVGTLISLVLMTDASIGAKSTRRVVVLTYLPWVLCWLWLQAWMIDVTSVGYVVFCLYLAIYPAAFVWLVRRLRIRVARAMPLTILVPIVWVGLECVRGLLWMNGYPWYLAAHPLIEVTWFVQSVDIFGTYFLSFLVAMTAGAIVDVWQGSRNVHDEQGDQLFQPMRLSRSTRVATALAGVALVGNFLYGWFRVQQTPDYQLPGPTILAIQTNLKQDNKMGWTWEQQLEDIPQFINLTREAYAEATKDGNSVDMIVWPETMVPGYGFERESMLFQRERNLLPGTHWLEALLTLQQDLDGIPLLVGSPAKINLRLNGPLDSEQTRYIWDESYNAAYLIAGDLPFQRYDKVFLTPFGETMPYISAWPWLEEQLLALGAAGMTFDLEAGDTEQQPLMLDDFRFVTPICFEDTSSTTCRDLIWEDGKKQADVIVNISNDGWFGRWDMARTTHLQIARFRCIENRIPMMRSVNTGMSASIDSVGKIIAHANNGRHDNGQRPGWVTAAVTFDERNPVFGRIGNLFAYLCALGLAVMWLLSFRKRRPTED